MQNYSSGFADKRFLVVVPILIGLAITIILVKTSKGPTQSDITEIVKSTRVISVPSVDISPGAIGYGTVTPSVELEAVAEVDGKVIEMLPILKKGSIVAAGSTLIKIDPVPYELEIDEIETTIQSTQAQIDETFVEEENTKTSLEIESKSLEFSKKELDRLTDIVDKGAVSRSSLDQQERTYLTQLQSVQSLKNSLNLIPVQRKLLRSQLAGYQAQLASAKLDLENTVVNLPFDGRIAEVNIEVGQYVRVGDVMTIVDGIDKAEVTAQIPISRVGPLVQKTDISSIEVDEEMFRKVLGFEAVVRVPEIGIEWDARFVRMNDTIDPKTRTMGVIVEVDAPYENAVPGVRPPLIKGMFVEVEIKGKPISGQIVIPRSALHEDRVYVVNKENRLEMKKVETGIVQPDYVSIKSGIDPGDSLVISDLIPAIEGMLIKPVVDEDTRQELINIASGAAQ